jgi:ABC-type polysaccharide/polyol phosphate export permease
VSSVAEPRTTTSDTAIDGVEVNDLSLIPEEPPPELHYKHRAGFIKSARNVWNHREIIFTLAERDFRAQYKQATLGVLWAVLAPVAMLVTFIIVFSRVKSFGTQGIPYPLYAYTGILCWTFFAQSLGTGGNSLLVNKSLLEKTQFPRECFPLETLLVNGVNTVMSWVPLAILFIIAHRAPHVGTLWVPVFMVIELAFAAGVALGVSAIVIQMRDLVQVLPVITSLGLFATPVIWPFSEIPRVFQPIYSFINPIGPIIDNARRTMLLGRPPHLGLIAVGAAGALTYLVVGYTLFKRFEVNFADIA